MHFLLTDISSSMFYNNINKFKENFEMTEAMGADYFCNGCRLLFEHYGIGKRYSGVISYIIHSKFAKYVYLLLQQTAQHVSV